jgi:threonine aldolase
MSLYGGGAELVSASECICDLRSDTVTRPSAAMRAAMAEAEVGDDVYGEDPSVNRLEATLAEMLGKQAGLFLPTGTQSNLAALMAHCGRGDEVLVGDSYHIYRDEAAGASVLAGIAMTPLPTEEDASICAPSVTSGIKPDDPHYPRTRLLCLENTVGGKVVALERMSAASDAARTGGLAVHLDGARFFNAITALGCTPSDLAGYADAVSVCLSKGLGAPAGSVLLGPTDVIARARRHRKILGGSMRQSGVLAAAGLFALEHRVPHLAEDHDRANQLGAALIQAGVGAVRVASNMVFLAPDLAHHGKLQQFLAGKGIRIGSQKPQIRMVLHGDVTDAGLGAAIAGFAEYIAGQ